MKKPDAISLARKAQEQVAFKALTRYSKEYGEPSENTLAIIRDMIKNLQCDDEDTVVSAIVFAEEMDKPLTKS